MYLYGAGGHAKVIMDILRAQGDTVEGVVDDNPEVKEIHGIPVVHDSDSMSPMIVSIGNNAIRKRIAERLSCKFGTAVHPSALISDTVTIGEGTVVMHGAIIQTDSRIGRHCIINTGSQIDHECHIGDYVHISPNATLCGAITIGEGAWIGAGAVIITGVKIGKWSVIGAGTVVTKDIPDNVLAYGNNCKVRKEF